MKQAKFVISVHFLENTREEWPQIWHVDVFWSPSEQLDFGHGLLLFLILVPFWLSNHLACSYLSMLGLKLFYVSTGGQGLPYIPRVHLSEGSLVRSPLKWLWSEEPMVRTSFIPKSLYSESCYVPKIPYSERPSTIWILCCEGSLVRSSSSPKGAMFRTSIFRKSPFPHTGSISWRSFSPKFPQF